MLKNEATYDMRVMKQERMMSDEYPTREEYFVHFSVLDAVESAKMIGYGEFIRCFNREWRREHPEIDYLYQEEEK